MGLKTTTAGWFPKPAALRRARWRLAEGEIEAGELQTAEREATREALRVQESLGLDLLVDGQMERGDMVGFLADRLEGMEPGGLVRVFDNRYYRRPRIVGPLERARDLTVEHWSWARRATSRPLKAVLTGPYTIMDWSFDEHYESREACCLALAEVVRAEAAALVAAGATEIQLDEPAIAARPEELDLAASALSRVTEDLRSRARTWVHLAYGDLGPVLDGVLRLPVDGLMLELANSGLELVDSLDRLPPDKLLAAGIVDVLRAEVEDDATLRERVDRLLERVPAERLWLAPDAGLRTLSPEVVEAKLAGLVRVASGV